MDRITERKGGKNRDKEEGERQRKEEKYIRRK
jgi:hypothetical protein